MPLETPQSSEWIRYVKTGGIEARPYLPGEDLEAQGVSVSPGDTPEPGGMIARDPDNHDDMWYINPSYFSKNYIMS